MISTLRMIWNAAVIFRQGCLTMEMGNFGEGTRHFLFGFFPPHC